MALIVWAQHLTSLPIAVQIAQVDPERVGDVPDFVDTDQTLALFVHVFPQGDDDMLDLLLLLDVLGQVRDVLVVQGSVDLVHKVKRELLYLLTRKYQRQRGQCLFPTGQKMNALPGLVEGSDKELKPLKGVHGVEHVDFSVALR